MGAGKTEAMLSIVKKNMSKRVLVITCRKTLVSDIGGRAWKAGLQPTIYCETERKDNLKNAKFLIIQGETMHYLKDATGYDYVIVDEWEKRYTR
jgi:superfamily II DNA or RNA helicase